ncbi:HNH endonuclease [Xenorhabdus sp. DI]|uniref:NUMOD4 domain-containing protein n=1 Tax=Xenorhabdus doucetiae TaxID=351671 RepID=UPI0019CB9A6C|nr:MULTISPECIES: NUMOD4 domain-containing protein [unclassified Xenorhabdus]MBD2786552.1 HNH endonuclease [Xenorhabdus sp. 3]MBD2790310.1 HNH endonuclease [Xenorhabdus sp. DI]
MSEIWKPISGYEERYEISNKGRVRSVSFKQRYLLRNGKEAFRQTLPKIIAQQITNSGYMLVHLHLNNHRKARTVHTLVAEAFLTGSGETVNHINGDKQDNSACNLEWASYSENHLHAVATGLNTQAVRVQHPITGAIYPSIAQAARACCVCHKKVTTWKRV